MSYLYRNLICRISELEGMLDIMSFNFYRVGKWDSKRRDIFDQVKESEICLLFRSHFIHHKAALERIRCRGHTGRIAAGTVPSLGAPGGLMWCCHMHSLLTLRIRTEDLS